MNMFEEARALRGMIKMCSLTQTEIAKKLGVSQSYVANKLRLLNFSDYLQMLILEANLTERHARFLLKLKGEEQVRCAIEKIRLMKLSVAASEALIDSMIIDERAKALKENSTRECVLRFEELITESVKSLMANGIKVRKSIDKYGDKKYITLCIDDSAN